MTSLPLKSPCLEPLLKLNQATPKIYHILGDCGLFPPFSDGNWQQAIIRSSKSGRGVKVRDHNNMQSIKEEESPQIHLCWHLWVATKAPFHSISPEARFVTFILEKVGLINLSESKSLQSDSSGIECFHASIGTTRDDSRKSPSCHELLENYRCQG